MSGYTCHLCTPPLVVVCEDGRAGWRLHYAREHSERPASTAHPATLATPSAKPVTTRHPRRRLGKGPNPDYQAARSEYDARHGTEEHAAPGEQHPEGG